MKTQITLVLALTLLGIVAINNLSFPQFPLRDQSSSAFAYIEVLPQSINTRSARKA